MLKERRKNIKIYIDEVTGNNSIIVSHLVKLLFHETQINVFTKKLKKNSNGYHVIQSRNSILPWSISCCGFIRLHRGITVTVVFQIQNQSWRLQVDRGSWLRQCLTRFPLFQDFHGVLKIYRGTGTRKSELTPFGEVHDENKTLNRVLSSVLPHFHFQHYTND